jgi:RNA polymerase sigma factor (sigma-70 family)
LENQTKDINQKLIEQCLRGDRKAQFELYQKYAKAMYNVSYRILKNSYEAEDAMQEGFLKAFLNLASYSGTVSFGAWLKKIIINTSLDLLRKNKVDFENIDQFRFADDQETAENDESILKFRIDQIKKAMELLPDGYRVIASLYLIEGYDHDEIAEILSVTASTSRSQLARAKRKLLEILNENIKTSKTWKS